MADYGYRFRVIIEAFEQRGLLSFYTPNSRELLITQLNDIAEKTDDERHEYDAIVAEEYRD